MALLPIIERELRVALRKQRPVGRRLKVAGLAVIGTLIFVAMAQLTGGRQASRELHRLFCLVGLYTVLRAPQLTAGLLAKERREQTLGLLFLSGLSSGEVFLSKLVSAAAIAFTDLLAIFPMLALPFLLGGISFDVFLATIVCLPTLLLFALTVSLLASVLTDDDGAAILVASALALIFCALPLAVYLVQTSFVASTPSRWWLLLSPAYGPWLIVSRLAKGSGPDVWKNLLLTLGWSLLCLGAAGFRLTRLWRDRPEEVGDHSWRQRWRDWVHGARAWRLRIAVRWLDVNPFAWLAARDRKPGTFAWLAVAGIVASWLAGFLLWPGRWRSVPILFATATLLNLSLRWIIYYSAASGLGNRRADGSYELLLTTPVGPGEIVWGQLEGLQMHFRAVCRAVFLLEVAMMLGGLLMRDWELSALFVYGAIWAALLSWAARQMRFPRGALLAMWAGLNSGRPAHATWRAVGLNLWICIWLLFNLGSGFSRSASFPGGSLIEVILAAFGVYLLLAYTFRPPETLDVIERRLVTEFREIVREPLPDPADPRFKHWKIHERFPWGWKLIQQQLHERLTRGHYQPPRYQPRPETK
jgi:hypothetical protein